MSEVYTHVDKVTQFGKMISDILPHGDLKRLPLGIELEDGVTDVEKEILYYGSHQASEYIHYMIRADGQDCSTRMLKFHAENVKRNTLKRVIY